MRTTNYPVNAAAGVFLPVYATQLDTYVRVTEEPAAGIALQGLLYQILDDGAGGFARTFSALPGEIVEIGSRVALGAGHGRILGNAQDQSGGATIPATLLLKIKSLAAATVVKVEEQN